VNAIGTDGAPVLAEPDGADVTFTQDGTGAQQITLAEIYLRRVFTPEMFADANIATDAGPSINRAIAAAASATGTARLAPSGYNVVTPIVDSWGTDVTGDGLLCSTIVFSPTSDNQICYRVRNAGQIVTGGSLKNVQFYGADDGFTKTAVEL